MSDERVLDELRRLEIETPSWGYGNSGTRFHVYPWPGAARNVWERIDDAALVHRLTGVCPSVAVHIPWDRVDDWSALKAHAEQRGIRIGAVNPNLFGEDDYRLGSVCNPDPAVRRRALDHCLECVAIAQEVGSTIISLWLADGTNYPGQDDLRSPLRPAHRVARGALRRATRWHAPARRVQVLRARLLQHRSPRLGHGRARLPPTRPAGAGARRHGPPRPGHERRADRRAPPGRRPARRLPLQQPQVRRRRPHGRGDRPVRALPHHARARRSPDRSSHRRDGRRRSP